MQAFEWTEKCSVGIPELDAQHRRLVELIAELVNCIQSGETGGQAAAALKELNRYAESHLQREELVLRIRGYPRYAEHKAEHDDYRARLAYLLVYSERGDFLVRLSNFVTEWWRFHVQGTDQEYARYFRAQSKASQAVE
ncbi:MAG: hemerythrin family protein [Bryobacteraceae bacterium]|jgi:hemerythrin